MTAPQHPHIAQESPEAAQIHAGATPPTTGLQVDLRAGGGGACPPTAPSHTPLGDLILDALKAAYNQGATHARPDSSAEAMRTATTHSMRASEEMWKAFAQVVVPVETVEPGRCRCGLAGCSDAGVRR